MPLGPDNSVLHGPPPAKDCGNRFKRRGTIRVLFGSMGWPCGVLEVASWAKRKGLAEPVILHLQAEDATGTTVWEGDSPIFPAGKLGQSPSHCSAEPFVEKLVEFDPHVVGFRIEGGQLDQVKTYVRAVRRFSDAEIVLGGPTATSHPLEVLEETGADYVFAGEAEEPFSQFLRLAWERNSKDHQPEIPGLAYHYGGRTYLNTLPRDGYGQSVLDADRTSCRSSFCCGKSETEGGMAKLVWPCADFSIMGKHAHASEGMAPDFPQQKPTSLRDLRHRVRPVARAVVIAGNRLDWSLLAGFDRAELDSLFFTGGRGCPGACTFCANLHGQEVRVKSALQLLDEIEAADAMVAAGKIQVTRWKLFTHVDDPRLKPREVTWAAIYDEDFFLHRKRAIEFFRLWQESPLQERYRLSLQTNPCSMLALGGQVHAELLEWIDRVKPMVQLGAESFNPELLARWHKRHNVDQLNTVLTALDGTRQDYTVFQLLTDFDTTPEELVETLRLLITNAYRRRRMRIASSPFTIPLYDSDTRRGLEFRGFLIPDRVRRFTDYERPQPGWMDPLAAELADLADAELEWTLHPEKREAALFSALEVVLDRICEEKEQLEHEPASVDSKKLRLRHLHDQARRAMDQVKDVRFQGIGPFEH